MSQRTKIEWATHTWNPVTGCTKVSAGCKHCYAERMVERFGAKIHGSEKMGVTRPFAKVTRHPWRLEEPMRWRKPRRVFVCSMSDLFHEDVPETFIRNTLWTMENVNCDRAEPHTFMVLTKRPKRMAEVVGRWVGDAYANGGDLLGSKHLWLGVSVEDQATADERIPLLLQTPAAMRFVSYEPALGPVDFKRYLHNDYIFCEWCGNEQADFGRNVVCEECGTRMPEQQPGVRWLICGGETGPGARPMHPDWARSARDQCQAAGVPFFLKQRGEWLTADEALRPGESSIGYRVQGEFVRIGKKRPGRLLDGREWNEAPLISAEGE